jgi:hypothetical protein
MKPLQRVWEIAEENADDEVVTLKDRKFIAANESSSPAAESAHSAPSSNPVSAADGKMEDVDIAGEADFELNCVVVCKYALLRLKGSLDLSSSRCLSFTLFSCLCLDFFFFFF